MERDEDCLEDCLEYFRWAFPFTPPDPTWCLDPTECPCKAVDQCLQFPCPANNACVNLGPFFNPSFYCQCEGGYEEDFTAQTDENGFFPCININVCESQLLFGGSPCDINADCEDTDVLFTCKCRDGFVGDGFTCMPMGLQPEIGPTFDELCALEKCNEQSQECVVVSPSSELEVQCTCKTGYEPVIAGGTPHNGENGCKDKNECEADPFPCDPNATCKNYEGGFICSCEGEFQGPNNGPCFERCPATSDSATACNVCGDGRCIQNPTGVAFVEDLGLVQCDVLQGLALAGVPTEEECTKSQTALRDPEFNGCECAGEVEDPCLAIPAPCDTDYGYCTVVGGAAVCSCKEGFEGPIRGDCVPEVTNPFPCEDLFNPKGCLVCGEGMCVQNFDGVTPALGKDMFCLEVELMGLFEEYTPAQCAELQQEVTGPNSQCQCREGLDE